MNKLQMELQRLYLFPGADVLPDAAEVLPLADPDGQVRAVVLSLSKPADWRSLSFVWQGVQADWGWPAPAIAVNGVDGYQLWFSLALPVALQDAERLVHMLRERFLPQINPERVCASGATMPAVPTQQGSGYWSAFVAPDLAPVFADDPWLDLRPSDEAQAEVLSRLVCIKASEFSAALKSTPVQTAPVGHFSPQPSLAVTSSGKPLHPKQFLQSVMEDPSVALSLRIEAAKALLPGAEGR